MFQYGITKYKRNFMTQHRDPKLDGVLAELQTRYGDRIIAPARQAEAVRLPLGIDSLDDALAGGLALRKLTQITGQPTSGATSLVHRAVARTQVDGGHAVYIDLANQFDPVTAAHRGVDIPALLLIRLTEPHKAIALTRDLLANGASSLIVLDSYCVSLNASVADARRLHQALTASSTALILISETPPPALTAIAETRIRIELLGWLRHGGTISGLHSRATIEDSRGERATLLEIRYETMSS
jgi:hypothetical protein